MLLVQTLEHHEFPWCVMGGLAVNRWAEEPIATADVDLVIATASVEPAVHALEAAGFTPERFQSCISLRGRSQVSVQISTESFYQSFPELALPADVHGILMRVASLADTLAGKLLAWRDPERRPSKRQKDWLDILRLVEAHPDLKSTLPADALARLADS